MRGRFQRYAQEFQYPTEERGVRFLGYISLFFFQREFDAVARALIISDE